MVKGIVSVLEDPSADKFSLIERHRGVDTIKVAA